MRVARFRHMTIELDTEQTEVLREVLQHDLTQLRVESARTDGHDFREMLHHREDVLQAVLKQLARAGASTL